MKLSTGDRTEAYSSTASKNTKKVLYFHNAPLSINGSKTINQRLTLIGICSKIVFNSEWSKNRFLTRLDDIYTKSPKLIVIKQKESLKT